MENDSIPHRTGHQDEEDKLKDITEPFLELEKHSKAANEKLRVYLMGLSQEDMVRRINELHLSDKSLIFLCEGIALEHEDYEICMAVEEIKKQRAAAKAAGQAV